MFKQKNNFSVFFILATVFIAAIFLSSCATTKPNGYFKNLKSDTTLSQIDFNKFEQKITAGDILAIKATSLSSVEDALFNAGGGESTTFAAGQSEGGFLVAEDGSIFLHRLGRVQAAGLSRKELAAKLSRALEPAYMKDVLVTVNFLNHKITVMGAVSKPQVLPLLDEKISVIDALVSSGDIMENGNYKNIMIIREQQDGKLVKHLNLEDKAILTSPWFYLQAGDVLYVQPDYQREINEQKQAKLKGNFALIVSVASFALLILDRIFR